MKIIKKPGKKTLLGGVAVLGVVYVLGVAAARKLRTELEAELAKPSQ